MSRGVCIVSDTINITFKECPPPIIPIIPNIITPNADGANDQFEIGNLPEGVFWSLKIYNRSVFDCGTICEGIGWGLGQLLDF